MAFRRCKKCIRMRPALYSNGAPPKQISNKSAKNVSVRAVRRTVRVSK